MIDRLLEYTDDDFYKIPVETNYREISCHSFIIVPTARFHDSGFKIMSFVLLDREDEIIARISGHCDVLSSKIPLSFDLLPCGYLRVFHSYYGNDIKICNAEFSSARIEEV